MMPIWRTPMEPQKLKKNFGGPSRQLLMLCVFFFFFSEKIKQPLEPFLSHYRWKRHRVSQESCCGSRFESPPRSGEILGSPFRSWRFQLGRRLAIPVMKEGHMARQRDHGISPFAKGGHLPWRTSPLIHPSHPRLLLYGANFQWKAGVHGLLEKNRTIWKDWHSLFQKCNCHFWWFQAACTDRSVRRRGGWIFSMVSGRSMAEEALEMEEFRLAWENQEFVLMLSLPEELLTWMCQEALVKG